MVHLVSSTGTLAITMVHNHLLLTHWLSLWYTTVFYWPNGHLCGTHPSSIGPLALPVVHYHLLVTHWPSLCDATIFSWPSCPVLWYTTFSTGPLAVSVVHYCLYLPIGCLYGTLLSSTGPLALPIVHNYLLLTHLPPHVSVVHYYLLLAHWLFLWYITIFFLPTGYLYDTLLPSPAHWLCLWYTTIYLWSICCLCGALLSSYDQLALSMLIYHLLLAHWLSLCYITIISRPKPLPM